MVIMKDNPYPGVKKFKSTKKWMAQPQELGQRQYLGLFSTEREAIIAALNWRADVLGMASEKYRAEAKRLSK